MWLAPKGFYEEQDPWGRITREDTCVCKHCQKLIFVKPKQDPNEFFCASCFAPICPQCKEQDRNRPAGQPCSHFERRIAEYENRMALHKALDREKSYWGETPFG